MSFPVTLSADDMMAFDTLDLLPLRQMVRPAQATAPALGDQRLLDRLSRPDRFRILRHPSGGQVLARNGLALAEAQVLLQQSYGPTITFGTPIVHRVVDHATGAVLVPMMFLRIDAPRAHRQQLQDMLAQRAAGPGEMASERNRVVLRMEAPLACLVGIEREVLDVTDGAAQVLCWLSRYAAAPRAGDT